MIDFLNLLIDAEYLQRQFDAHPRDMWAFTAFVFVLGVAVGCAASKLLSKGGQKERERELRETERARSNLAARLESERESHADDRARFDTERKRLEEDCEKQRNLRGASETLVSAYARKLAVAEERLKRYEDEGADAERRACESFREDMSFDDKKLLAILMRKPQEVPRTNPDEMRRRLAERFGEGVCEYVTIEEIGPDTVRVSIRDGSREFFERHPELLEDARKELPGQP